MRRPPGLSAAEVIQRYSIADPATGCWLWTATRTPAGYGHVWFEGRMQPAHRISYLAFIGPIPDGLYIDHLCRVRECCNPTHLEPVTNAENIRRGISGRRQLPRELATHCFRGHEYTPENTASSGPGRRQCRTCKRWRDRKYAAAT